jgi:hypothetical protein
MSESIGEATPFEEFPPSLYGLQFKGIYQQSWQSIQQVPACTVVYYIPPVSRNKLCDVNCEL